MENIKEIWYKATFHSSVTNQSLKVKTKNINLLFNTILLDGTKLHPETYNGHIDINDPYFNDYQILEYHIMEDTKHSFPYITVYDIIDDITKIIKIPKILYNYFLDRGHNTLVGRLCNDTSIKEYVITDVSYNRIDDNVCILKSFERSYHCDKYTSIYNIGKKTDTEASSIIEDRTKIITFEFTNKSYLCFDCFRSFTPSKITVNIELDREEDIEALKLTSFLPYNNDIITLLSIGAHQVNRDCAHCMNDEFRAIDTDILDEIKKLNDAAMITKFCCSGNPETHPNEKMISGYIMFKYLGDVNSELYYLIKYASLEDKYFDKIRIDTYCAPDTEITIRWYEYDKELISSFIDHIIHLWKKV